MEDLFTLENLFTLAMLVLLQAVLGFDNLLYISIESKRVESSKQSMVRKLGIGLAVVLRIILLIVVVQAIAYFEDPFVTWEGGENFAAAISVHSLIVMAGGVFIIYTAFKEIFHMLSIEHIEHVSDKKMRSATAAIFWITLMNLVFSFDSILSAIALTKNIVVMSSAIIIGGILMIVLADKISEFLKKNRMYEVLGLFILLIVGIMLVSEGAHLAHLKLFGYPIDKMSKSTFYFVIGVMVLVDLVQSRYQKKLAAQRRAETRMAPEA